MAATIADLFPVPACGSKTPASGWPMNDIPEAIVAGVRRRKALVNKTKCATVWGYRMTYLGSTFVDYQWLRMY